MQNKAHWIFFGPALLCGGFFVLLFHASALIGRPVWTLGLTLSICMATFITYLTQKELLTRLEKLKGETSRTKKTAESYRSTLDEAQALYREKVEKLEEAISDQDSILLNLQNKESMAEREAKQQKNRALAFETSLQDALDELREARQIYYLEREMGKILPKNLPSQHKQLRDQFEEKSMILDQTRRRLFTLEGQLLALKKEQAMLSLSEDLQEEALLHALDRVIEENENLEKEVVQLEALLSHTPSAKKKEKKAAQVLEFQF